MSSTDKPLVSIAIITYNQKDYLRECIESCLAQDYPNFEIVVADDCSTDGTQDLLREYEIKYPGKFVLRLAEKNQGITKNCNMAWRACKGLWIKSIAGDDMLLPECLSVYMNEVLNSDVIADVYFADMIKFDENKKYKEISKPSIKFFNLDQRRKIESLLVANILTAPTSFIRKMSLASVGYADERFEMLEDYPLWMRLLENNKVFRYLDKVVVMYRLSESLSQSKKKIGNEKYIDSLYSFQKDIIWPKLSRYMIFRKISDAAEYYHKKIGIKYLNNKKSAAYYLVGLFIYPFQFYRLCRRFFYES